MSIPENGFYDVFSQDTPTMSFSEMSSIAFEEFSRIARKATDIFLASSVVIGETALSNACKAKKIVLGSACTVAGAAFQGAAGVIKMALPPASGAVALYIARDALASIGRDFRLFAPQDKEVQISFTILFAVFGSIALTYSSGAISSWARDISVLCYTKSDAYFNA